jgi:hypothetical protein
LTGLAHWFAIRLAFAGALKTGDAVRLTSGGSRRLAGDSATGTEILMRETQ